MADSDEESAPPSAAGAGDHTAAATLHPLWASASGRGGKGRGKGSGNASRGGKGKGRMTSPSPAGSEAGDMPCTGPPVSAGATRFFPISVMDLEMRHRATADGAESSLWSADEDEEREEEHVAGISNTTDAEATSTRTGARKMQAKRPREGEVDPMMSAVFGGGDSNVSEELSADEESSVGGGEDVAERRLKAQKRAFHIRGVSCLGCSMDRDQVEKVDKFIRDNQARLEQTALFKAASLYWKQLIVDPARAEGVEIPIWEWKNLRSHYLLHALMPEIQRADCVRQLAAMRKTLEMSMLREDEEGNRGLDPKASELMMKLIGMQSKELQLLQAASMPPPPARPSAARNS